MNKIEWLKIGNGYKGEEVYRTTIKGCKCFIDFDNSYSVSFKIGRHEFTKANESSISDTITLKSAKQACRRIADRVNKELDRC